MGEDAGGRHLFGVCRPSRDPLENFSYWETSGKRAINSFGAPSSPAMSRA